MGHKTVSVLREHSGAINFFQLSLGRLRCSQRHDDLDRHPLDAAETGCQSAGICITRADLGRVVTASRW